MKIFDAHTHIWSDDRARYPMVKGRERPTDHYGSVERLLEFQRGHDVVRTLLVQTPWYGEDNRYFVDTRQRMPRQFVLVGFLESPHSKTAADRLSRQYDEDGIRGVRLHLIDPAVADAVQTGHIDRLLAKCRELAIPVKLLARLEHTESIERIARRFSDVVLILDHMLHPKLEGNELDRSMAALASLAKCRNTVVMISQYYRFSRREYPWPDVAQWIEFLANEFGSTRMMWGSDFPMWQEIPYETRVHGAQQLLQCLSGNEREAVFYRTAANLWPIEGSIQDDHSSYEHADGRRD